MSRTDHLTELESLRLQVAELSQKLAERDQSMQDLREQSDLLRAIVQGTATDAGEEFFRSLVRHLAQALNFRYAFVGKWHQEAPDSVRTLAAWSGTDFAESFEYTLQHTPCANVVGQRLCLHESGVQQLFPEDHLLAQMNVESYCGMPLFDRSGKPLGLLVVMDNRPMTRVPLVKDLLQIFAARAAAELQRQQDDEALRENERRLRFTQFALDRAKDGVLWADDSKRFTYANEAACRLLGYSKEELLTLSISDVVPYHDPARFQQRLDQIEQGTTTTYESVHRRKDGTEFPVEASVTHLEHEGNGYTCGIVRDITERKRIEQERLQALYDLQNIMETVPDFLFTLDSQGNLLKWNKRVAEVTGYTPEELRHKPALAFVPAEERDRAAAAIQQAFVEGYAELDGHLLTKEHRLIPYHWTGATLKTPQGATIGITGVGRDVSQRKRIEEEMRVQRASLVAAQALAHVGSWEWDIESGSMEWSDEQFRIFGHEPQSIAMTQETFLAALLPDDHDPVLAAIDSALARQALYDVEYRIVRPSGEVRTLHCRGEVHRDDKGHPVSMYGSALDITDRKRAELALTQSEEHFRALIEHSSDIITVLGLDGTIRYESPSFERRLGYAQQELNGRIAFEFVHEDDLPAVLERFQLVVQRPGEPQTAEFRFRHKDNSWRIFEGIGQAIRDSQGLLSVIVNSRDITERKRGEQALRTSQEKLRQALQASNTGLWDWNTETSEVSFSREWKRQLGYEEAELTDAFESWETRLHPDDHEWAVAFVQTFLVNRVGDYRQEFRLRHKDGTYRWIEARASFVTEPDGRRIRLIGSHTDITERKRAEELLSASKKQLQDILDSLFGFVALYTLDGRIVEINRAPLEIGGVSKEDVLDRYFWETPWWSGLPDMQSRLQDWMGRAAQGEIARGELVFRVPGGHMATADATFGPLRDAAGAIINVIGFGVDITERKRAEEALRSSEFRLNKAQRLAQIGSWELDLLTNNLTWSDEIYRIFEIDSVAFQASYEGFLNLVHPDDREMVDRAYSDSVASRTPYDITHRLLMKDGRIKFVQEQCRTDYLPDGTPERSLGTVQDITERKQTEDALQFLSTGITHLSGEAFFSEMAIQVAKLLGLEIGFVGKLLATQPPRIRAIGLSIDGQAMPPVEYDLAQTPCERVIGKQTAIFPEDVQQLFPDDQMLVDLGVSSYAAIPLFDMSARPIGHVGVMSRRPLHQVKQVEDLLRLFSVRTAAELERQRTETKFHDLFEFSPDAIIMVNQEGLVTLANCQAESLFGYSRAEFLGLPVERLMPETSGQANMELRQQFLSSAKSRMMGTSRSTLRALKKDGTIFPIDISLSPIQSEEGMLVVAAVRDITEHKRAEKALCESEERYRMLVDLSPNGVFVYSNRKKVYVNQAACEILRASSPEQLFDNPTVHFSHPDVYESIHASIAQILATGEPIRRVERKYQRLDGTVVSVEVDAGRIMWNGKPAVQVIFADITERKQTEEALRISEERFRAAYQNAVVGMSICDMTGRLLEVNQALCEILGYSKQELLATDFQSLTHPDDLPGNLDRIRELMTGAVLHQVFEKRYLRKDGDTLWTHVGISLIRNQDGTPLHLLAMVQNITERKRIQAEETIRLQRLKRLAAWSLTLVGEPGEVFAEAVRIIGELFGVRTVCLSEVVGTELHFRAVFIAGQVVRDAGYCPLVITPCATVETTKDLCVFDRVMERFPEASFLRDHQAVAYCGIPSLDSRGQVVAVTCLLDDKPHVFDEEEQELLRIFGQRIATEIERSQHLIERNRAEKDRRESEERFSYVIEATNDGIWDWDVQTNRVHFSPQWIRLLGYSPAEVSPSVEFFLSIIHPEDKARMTQVLQDHMEGRTPVKELELRLRQKSGEYWWYLDRGKVVVRDKDGRPLRMVGTITDITERKWAEETLRQRERELRTVLDALPVGVWFTDATGKVHLTNPAGRQIWNGAQQVGMGNTEGYPGWWENVNSSGEPHRWALARALTKGEATLDEELNIQCLDGTSKTIINSAVPLFGEHGQVSGAIIVNQDITERKALESDRSQNQAFLQSILENIPHIITVKEAKTLKLVQMNQAAEKMLGLSRHEIAGKSLYDYLPENEANALWAADLEALQCRTLVDIPEHVVKREGESDRIFRTKKVPILDAAGEPQYLLTISEDITERKQAEEAVRQSYAFIRQIIDINPNFIFVKDREGRFTLVNQAVADAYGSTVEDLVGKTDADFNPNAEEVALVRQIDMEVMDSQQERFIAEELITDVHGNRRWLQTVKRPLLDRHGHAHMVLGTASDITERKRIEETLLQRESDLRAAIEERERISQDLHDGILQSLFAVGLALESAKLTMPPRNLKTSRASLDQAIDQLNDVMREIRNFIAGLGSDLLQGKNFPAVLKQMLASLTEHQETHVRLAVEDRAAKALSAEQSLHMIRVIQEAVSNCIKHGHAQEASVSLKMLKRGVRLRVRDNGRGFNPNGTKGIGHGLSNMAARAQKIGGRFRVSSKPNEGTSIVLDLPAIGQGSEASG